MNWKLLAFALPCVLFSICLSAQKKKRGAMPNRVVCTYGDVKPEDFAPVAYAADSSAEAVYLFDGGASNVTGSSGKGFEVVYKVHTRIRLLKKNAFHLATLQIPLFVTSDFQQKIDDVKATTYNLSGSSVATASISKNDIFQEKRDDKHMLVKLTLPNVTEGSIIEYSYTIKTPGENNLPDWTFQKDYPVLWSDYEVTYPLIFNYVHLKQGYQPYAIDTVKITNGSFLLNQERDEGIGKVNETLAISSNVADCIWAMKNIPALKEEPFTTTLENYIAKIGFQLSSIQYATDNIVNYMRTWPGVSDTLLKNDYYFGKAYVIANGFLDNDIQAAIAGAANNFDKVKKIYEWVRDNYTSTGHYPWLQQSLRKIEQSKKGNSTEINLILTIMLKNAGFDAYPVLLSTTDHGKAYKDYPILEKYNSTICQVGVDGKKYLLDASHDKLGFNHLAPDCYNGYARVINPVNPELINLSADSLKESKLTSMFVVNEKGNKLSAAISSTKGYQESLSLREQLSKESEGDFFKNIKKAYSGDIEISDENIDSLKLLNEPVKVNYNIKMDIGDDDIFYFNPMFAEQQKDNPFTAAERLYPVEMPYCWDETYILNMEIPEGYAVDELPKSARVKLNDNEGMFEYLIAKNGNNIQLRTRVKLEKAVYEPEDYQTLRDFFTYIVKKEAEQIVFKKVKN